MAELSIEDQVVKLGEEVRVQKEAGCDVDDLVYELNELKLQLPADHKLALSQSAAKKHQKIKDQRAAGKIKKKKPAVPVASGEGKNAKMAKKMQNVERFVNLTPEGQKKDLSTEMATAYDPEAVEAAWYSWWEQSGFFKPDDNDKDSERFVIMIPPPNVTGSLHIGHGLTCSIQDCLVRWHRMQGHNTLWLPGTDHAGIATQVVVEKQLFKEEKVTRHDLGREKFLEKVWEWKESKGAHISNQLRLTGASVDWSREAFTMDAKLSKAVIESFNILHDRGVVFREKKLIDWCCALQSVISKIEIDQVDIEGETTLRVPGYDKPVEVGFLFDFAYKVEDSEEEIIVSTTRPETMLGDTAVAVHPDDERYKHLVGKKLIHPFVDRKIPIVTDSVLVDMSFGTGAVKITPAHDPNDYLCGKRNNLPFIDMMTDTGFMNDQCGEFTGMKRYDARTKVMKRLEEMGLARGRKGNKMSIPTCSRTGDILEPRLKPQWFVDCKDMARRAVEAVEQGELKLHPESHKATWFHWLRNIQDWCVSRQLWWGHRIPAWFATVKGTTGDMDNDTENWFVARNVDEARAKASAKLGVPESEIELEQDPDVLDTWYSSGLFPFSTLGWPDKTGDMGMYFPGHLLETGYDILFFWVARMVMFGLELLDTLPFKDVFLHTLVKDKYGRKMSKTLGNVIDPLWVIYGTTLEELHANVEKGNLAAREVEKAKKAQTDQFPSGIAPCGSDGLRFALLYNTTMGSDVNLDINVVVTYRNFCNKVWQATRFALPNLDGFTPAATPMGDLLSGAPLCVRYIISRLNNAVKKVNASFAAYEFHDAAHAANSFFHEEFCDVFLEYVKSIMSDKNHPQRPAAQEALYTCLETSYRLMHPMLPFLTEELWQRLPRRAGEDYASIMIAKYPEAVPAWNLEEAEAAMGTVLAVARAMRSTKSQYRIAPKLTPEVFVRADEASKQILETMTADIMSVCKMGNITLLDAGAEAPRGTVLTRVNDSVDVCLMLAGNVDIAAEVKKLEAELAKKVASKTKIEREVADTEKYSKKPEEKRAADTERLETFTKEIAQINKDIESFNDLL